LKNKLLFTFIVLWIGLPLTAEQPKADFAELEKVALEELKEINAPGAAIAVVLGGKVVFAKGFGVANIETGTPMTPDMLCRIGSTTKMLTASVLVSLAEEGKVRLDEPVGKYVQGLHPSIAALTAHQLLCHTAGLKDDAQMHGRHDDSALGEFVRSWKEDFFFTQPGKIYSYSNPGYHLAGLLIEAAGGKPYADMMSERLFKPLGMNSTTLRPTVAMTYPLSQGHEARGKEKPTVIRPFADNVANWPAGSVFTSANEFARFAIAFLNGGRIDGKQALSPAVIGKLSTPHADLPGQPDTKYGYGLTIREHRGVRVLQHGGARSGFGSSVRMAPEHRLAVIVLVNRTGGGLPRTVEKATELLLPLEPEPVPKPKQTLPLTEAEMGGYAGVYKNGSTTAEIAIKEGKLVLKMRGAEFPLSKLSADRLGFTPPGAPRPEELVVVMGADGKPEYLHRGGRSLKKASGP